ncbi:replication protein A 70 kDa DNA-binding subunit A-like [Lolium rigidum]|uniref:replication protein A 70 kDa DNA-binding subunit A-like n=1 Tax=Lolium rigidum TaxID=89674 RepID=UPI001F5DFE8D|nr:replication protein A 70 kDa DNA-binding subunit A-like [Lolium rigidum]
MFTLLPMAFNLLSEIHSDNHQWMICVLVSRMWHYRGGTDEGPIQHTDLVLLDVEGNHMYGQLPPATSERLKDVLEEGKVFVIRKFFCNPSKPTFRPVESPFMVQFTRYTTVEERPGLADTYPFCRYSLTSFTDIPVPCGRAERFIDVIGKIDMVSDVIPVQSMYQQAASNTRTVILKDLLGNEIRLVLWGDRALEFDAEAVCAMGEKEPVIAIFVGTLPKASHGVRGLSGSSACRWYIDEDIPDINLFREKIGPQFVPLATYVPTGPGAIAPRVYEPPAEKTLEQLNEVDPFVDMEKKFLCTATVDRLGADQRWWFASCSVCRKSSKHDGCRFRCSGKDCDSSDVSLAYCISFFATDATGESEFVMFEKVAAGAVGKQLMNLMRQRYPGYYMVDELANVARHDTAIPAEIERLVGHKYKLLVSISKKWNSGNSENLNFQVCRIEETYKPELPPLAFAASSRSAGASSSAGGSGSRLLPLGPTLSHVHHRAATFGGSHSSGNATPPSPIASPGTPAKGSSAPKRGTKRSLFSSPPKRNTQLADACAAAAEEEPATLVEPVEDDGITTDVEKNGPPPNPKSKRNANSAKSGTLPKKAKP